MRKCAKCGEEKKDSEFHKKGESRHSYCKPCFNEYCTERWLQKKLEAIKYKGGECAICGYNKHYGSLSFHHLERHDKEMEWDRLRLRSWDKIKIELDKCVLVCSNCHEEIHGGLHSEFIQQLIDLKARAF